MPEPLSCTDQSYASGGYVPTPFDPDSSAGSASEAGSMVSSDDPPAAAAELQCAAPSAGTASLVASYPKRGAQRPHGDPSPMTNAERTVSRGIAPYAEAAVSPRGEVHAGLAGLKGRDAATGVEVETFTASAQVGIQTEVQAGLARVGGSTDDGIVCVTADTFTARAHAGIHNDDGSLGANVGVAASAVALEVSTDYSGWGAGAGIAAGPAFEAHVGLRDDDADGKVEVCFGATAGVLKGRLCAELPEVGGRS